MSFFSNLFNDAAAAFGAPSWQQQANAKFNAEQQKELWNYQMSNAHQLEVADLRKAGLNPILSANGNSGFSMPGSVMPSSSNASKGLDFFLQKKQANIAEKNADTEAKKAETQRLSMENEAKRIDQDIKTSHALQGKYSAEMNLSIYDLERRPDLVEAELKERATRSQANLASAANSAASAEDHMSHKAVNERMYDELGAEIERLRAEGRVSNAQADRLIHDLNVDKEHGILFRINRYSGPIVNAFGSAVKTVK